MDFFNNIDLNQWVQRVLISVIPFMFAITVHEVSHGFVAYLMGDNTARNAGRLTLNPIKHIDPVGLLFLLVTRMFGWAKPVPVDFRVIRRYKYGPLIVAAAGPVSNFILAIISVIIVMLLYGPLRGMTSMMPERVFDLLLLIVIFSIQINIALGVFNLIPLLPMDGGRILHNLLPPKMAYQYGKLEKWGFIILVLLMFTGVIQEFIWPILHDLNNFALRIALGRGV